MAEDKLTQDDINQVLSEELGIVLDGLRKIVEELDKRKYGNK